MAQQAFRAFDGPAGIGAAVPSAGELQRAKAARSGAEGVQPSAAGNVINGAAACGSAPIFDPTKVAFAKDDGYQDRTVADQSRRDSLDSVFLYIAFAQMEAAKVSWSDEGVHLQINFL